MAAIGWIWASLMLLGGLRAHLAQALPDAFATAMLLSGMLAMPLLWNRANGMFAAIAPSGAVRAALAMLVLAVPLAARPDALVALIAV
jgi:hypothetical protein